MLFIRSERARRFDRTIQRTKECAEQLGAMSLHPEVREAVDSLLPALDRLFLPNLRNGTLEVPRRHRNREGYGYWPLLLGERNIYVGNSFDTPTPEWLRMIKARTGLTREQVTSHLQTQASGPPERETITEAGEVFSGFTHPTIDGRTVHVQSRPLIVTTIPGSKPPVLIHELVHSYDSQQRWLESEPDDEQSIRLRAEEELRAYYVEAASACITPSINPYYREIEDQRVRYTSPDKPFEPTAPIIRFMLREEVI